jgi:hypothetical protein
VIKQPSLIPSPTLLETPEPSDNLSELLHQDRDPSLEWLAEACLEWMCERASLAITQDMPS